MAEGSSHQSDGLGLWLSRQRPLADSVYLLEPELRYPKGQLIKSTDAWLPVRSVYTARGDEAFLTIGNFQSDEAMVREERFPGERPSVYYYLDAVFVEPCPQPPGRELTRDTQLCQGQSIKITVDSTAWTAIWSDGSRSPERIFTDPGTYQVSLDFGCYQQNITYQIAEHGCDCSFRQQGPNVSQWQWPLELVRSEIRLFDARGQYLGAFSRESLEAFAKNLTAGIYFFDMQLACAEAARETYRQTGSFIIVTQ